MGDTNQLFESLFRSKIGEETEVEYLKQLTSAHPYFSPAQFFLLQRTNETDPSYGDQAARTALLFNNHFWLNLKLEEARDHINNVTGIKSPDQATDLADKDEVIHPVLEDEEKIIVDDFTDREDGAPDEGIDDLPAHDKQHLATAPHFSTGISVDRSINEAVPVTENGKEIPVVAEDSFVEDYPDAVVKPAEPGNLAEAPVNNAEILPIAEVHQTAPADIVENQEYASGEEAEIDLDEQRELAPMNVKLNLEQAAITGDTLTFEPLHTTDYFASQGIKLTNEVQSTDKLGKQLKSFTEWLKTMKKVHVDQPADTGNQTDVTIQQLAEKSNAEDEVVTEAMADVLIQQGKAGKALDVYRKLSLLNPAKSAYFAAKIDQLKEQ